MNFELITLPIRSVALLVLLGLAYYLGYGVPQQDWQHPLPGGGVATRYTRNNRTWRIFYDRDGDKQWDVRVDERGGSPYIVSFDDDGDGVVDREEDEWGNRLSTWDASRIRASKTLGEFVHNARQLVYTFLAVLLYILLEILIRAHRMRGSSNIT